MEFVSVNGINRAIKKGQNVVALIDGKPVPITHSRADNPYGELHVRPAGTGKYTSVNWSDVIIQKEPQ